MKLPKNKIQVRQELEREMQRYLSTGGSIQKIPNGISGNEQNENLFSPNNFQSNSANPRTPLNHVVKALEERKANKKKPGKKTVKNKPKKRLITDDFGDPVRWIWDEE